MSDTVKLIIEIPKSALELLNTTGVDWLDAEHILSSVAHGVPFEDVKAKIQDLYVGYRHGYEIKADVLQILDNIDNAESEDKE